MGASFPGLGKGKRIVLTPKSAPLIQSQKNGKFSEKWD